MEKRKDDIKHGTAQARQLVEEPMRVGYTAGTPLEAGKIADSEIVDFYANARNIDKDDKSASHDVDQPQLRRRQGGTGGDTSQDAV